MKLVPLTQTDPCEGCAGGAPCRSYLHRSRWKADKRASLAGARHGGGSAGGGGGARLLAGMPGATPLVWGGGGRYAPSLKVMLGKGMGLVVPSCSH